MKAVQMTATGGPEVLDAREIPEPRLDSPTAIKVRLKAAGVNPLDTKLRRRGLFFPDALPAVLGCDGAGIVVETGAAVTRFRPGDEVWFCHGGLGLDAGNYAEYTVLEEAFACAKPRRLKFAAAAGAPLVLITAWEALYDRARLRDGQTVLVHGGAGGVGHVAVQLARKAGARVCATVGSREKAEFVRALGAEHAIVYPEEDFVAEVMAWTGGSGADVVLDTVGGEVFQRSQAAVAHYGDLVTLLDPGKQSAWKEARNRNLRVSFELMLTPMLAPLPEARRHQVEILDECRRWCEEGELEIHVGGTFPLARAADAHRRLEAGHVQGKLVLLID